MNIETGQDLSLLPTPRGRHGFGKEKGREIVKALLAEPAGPKGLWERLPPGLAKEIDQLILAGQLTQLEICKGYGLSRGMVIARKKKLFEAIQDATAGRESVMKSQAKELLGWTVEKNKELHDLAKNRKSKVITKDGPMLVKAELDDPEAQVGEDGVPRKIMDYDNPDFETMALAIKQVHDVAKTVGEIEGELGKVRELREQARIVTGAGGTPGVSQHQHLHVLVMPKGEGVVGSVAAPAQLPMAQMVEGVEEEGDWVEGEDEVNDSLEPDFDEA